ncbi:MAG TPA: Ig-like domain-containing protein [Opitutaceae bacterium]|nr:Ig-like domain-containing protein [Opitutaceae bacterium]
MKTSISTTRGARCALISSKFFLVALLALTGVVSRGEVLVGYQMDNFPGTDSLSGPDYLLPTTAVAGSFTDSRLETLALSVGPSFSPGNQTGFYRFNGSGVPTTEMVSGNYVEFTLQPLPGYAFSLDATNSLQFNSRTYDVAAGVFVRSSLDNYATTLAPVVVGDGLLRSFSLAGFSDVTTAVTFRVYIYAPDGAANLAIRSGGTLGETGNLDFVINGTITEVGLVHVTGVTVAPESAPLIVNDTLQLTATLSPADASFQSVTWASDDTDVATVDGSGLVTAVGEGTATITATTDDGGFQDTCEITVTRVPVTGVGVAPTSASLDINAKVQLIATVAPADASFPGVSWSSSDSDVAAVDSEGLVTAVATGEATITVTTADGGFTADSVVTVSNVLASGIGVVDDHGWTTLIPSPDSLLVYVSSSEGDDNNDGLSAVTPKATIDAADALVREGYPDWMLLKRGDVFLQPSLGRWKNGRSASEPMVLTYYGDSGPRPLIKLTGSFVNWNGQPRNNQAFVGLDLYHSISDPDSPDFTNASSGSGLSFNSGPSGHAFNLLVEDVRLRFCSMIVQGQNEDFFVHNAHIRRNIIINVWAHGSTDGDVIVNGMFVRGVEDIFIEENLFHHNGWNAGIPDALANQFNHNLYMQHSNFGEVLVRGNLLSFGSAHGVQLRQGGTAVMNAFVGNAVSMNFGYSSPPANYFGLTFIEDNVITDGRPMIPNDTSDPQTGAIWGLSRGNFLNNTAFVNDNIVANILDNRGGNMRPYDNMAANSLGTGNIGWNWVQSNVPSDNPGWLDPNRNAASFAASRGFGDWSGYIAAAVDRPLGTMPFDLTAYAYVNYIREGFNKSAVGAPYEYDPDIGEIIPVTGVSLPVSLTLNAGEQQTLYPTIIPANATNQTVTWSSSDDNVATVDAVGLVSAVASGTATITVTTIDGGFQASTSVTVESVVIPVTGVSVTPESATIELGSTRTLLATVAPANASDTGVTWASSNPDVATVSGAGIVTAVATGAATITATTNDAGFTDSTEVVVSEAAPSFVLVGYDMDNFPGNDSLSGPDYLLPTTAVAGSFTDSRLETLALSVGASFSPGNQTGFYRFNGNGVPTTEEVSGNYVEFTLQPLPGIAFSLAPTNSLQFNARTYDVAAGVFVRSSLDNYATTLDSVVGGDGGVRSFSLAGFSDVTTAVTFRVYIYAPDGSANLAIRSGGTLGETGNLDFVINGSITELEITHATGVSVSPESATVTTGDSVQLTANVIPGDATIQSVTWTSSNPDVATVDAAGLVTSLAAGTTTITATTTDGGFQDDSAVTVEDVAVTGVSVEPDGVTLDINVAAQLTASVTPANATNPAFTWSSSDPAIATVNSSGKVTAISSGSATITATTADGGFTDECLVTVTSTVASGIGLINADGWTVLVPSADSRLVYVSTSQGDDGNDGLSPETPKATIDAANELIRDGYPDWMLLKRGDTFAPGNLGRWKSGRSATEPLVLTYYGDSGPRPVIKLINNQFVAWEAQPRHNTAYVGLDFYRSISDPHSPDFTNTSGGDALWFNCGPAGDAYNVLVEDCRFRYCGLTIRGQQSSAPFVHNVHVRRNVIMHNWRHNSETSDAIIQGLHCVAVMGLHIEENLIHHNGWSEDVPGALANQFNHNVYLQFNNGGEIVVTGNIISFGAAHGIQLRAGGIATMNAFVGNAISMNVGYSSPPLFYTGPTVIHDNVVTDGRPMIPNDSSDPQTGAIWGLWHDNIENPTFVDNIVANILDDRGVNMRPFSNLAVNQFGTGNIAWNWVRDNNPAEDPGWLDPTRNADSFGTAMGWGNWNGFIAAAADRGVRMMPYGLSAYAYVDYIREGFSKVPVAAPFEFDDSAPANNVPDITTQSLNDGTFGESYTQSIAATGGDGAHVWTLVSGSLPEGLELAVDGSISGTTTAAGASTFIVQVADSDSFHGPADEDRKIYTLTIAPAQATVTLDDLVHTYDGGPKSALATTTPPDLPVEITYDGSSSAPVNAGSYEVVATVTDPNYTGSAIDTLVIMQAPAVIMLGDLLHAYDGTPKSATATTVPVNLNVVFTYDGASELPTLPGTYAVVVTIEEQNYTGAAGADFVIATAGLVRRGPTISGDVDGSVQVLLPEAVSLTGGATIDGNLLIPGTPKLVLNGGALYAGVIDGPGSVSPTGHRVTLGGGAAIGYLVRHVDAIAMPVVDSPPAPSGNADVVLATAAAPDPEWSLVRDLTLKGSAGVRVLPAGTYGSVTVNSGTGLVLGVAGSSEPLVYNLQGLVLKEGSQLQIAGPVRLTVANGVTNQGNVGNVDYPRWLDLRIAAGDLTLKDAAVLHSVVRIPQGAVSIDEDSILQGEIIADQLILKEGGYLSQPLP